MNRVICKRCLNLCYVKRIDGSIQYCCGMDGTPVNSLNKRCHRNLTKKQSDRVHKSALRSRRNHESIFHSIKRSFYNWIERF